MRYDDGWIGNYLLAVWRALGREDGVTSSVETVTIRRGVVSQKKMSLRVPCVLDNPTVYQVALMQLCSLSFLSVAMYSTS